MLPCFSSHDCVVLRSRSGRAIHNELPSVCDHGMQAGKDVSINIPAYKGTSAPCDAYCNSTHTVFFGDTITGFHSSVTKDLDLSSHKLVTLM